MTNSIDIRWAVTSPKPIPIQHQYPLLSAVSRLVPELHHSQDFGLHPIRGTWAAPGQMALVPGSAVAIRTSADNIPALLPLSGKKLDLAGCPIRLAVPRVIALSPCDSLTCSLVTIKGFMEADSFSAAVRRQLDELGISRSSAIEVLARRVLRIKWQMIIGFKVRLHQLSEEESLRIQVAGLGGRRHLGCGIFNASRQVNEQE